MRTRPNSCKICPVCKQHNCPGLPNPCVLDNCPLHAGENCCSGNVQCCSVAAKRQCKLPTVSTIFPTQSQILDEKNEKHSQKNIWFHPLQIINLIDASHDGPCGPPRNKKYPWLDWRRRPLITNNSTDEVHFTWNLKRRVPCIPDIYFQEMYDLNGNRVY